MRWKSLRKYNGTECFIQGSTKYEKKSQGQDSFSAFCILNEKVQ